MSMQCKYATAQCPYLVVLAFFSLAGFHILSQAVIGVEQEVVAFT